MAVNLSSEIYGVSNPATAAIQNEMHVTSHFNTHIFPHNYDNYVLHARLCKELLSCIFCVMNNTRGKCPHAVTHFP